MDNHKVLDQCLVQLLVFGQRLHLAAEYLLLLMQFIDNGLQDISILPHLMDSSLHHLGILHCLAGGPELGHKLAPLLLQFLRYLIHGDRGMQLLAEVSNLVLGNYE